MRAFSVEQLIEPIRRLCIQANRVLPRDVRAALDHCCSCEDSTAGQMALEDIVTNYRRAETCDLPICQDTGMALVWLQVGEEVFLEGDLQKAADEGVRRGYTEGYLRKSIVGDPLRRVNTKDNTPAVVYLERVPGDRVQVTVAPKGFGSENMSQLKMLKPADGVQGVKEFILKTVREAGPNPCPPIVVGVGIGGNFDRVALLAKKALLRETGSHHSDPYYADLETELLESINQLGIGPQGYGGRATAMAVHIETAPTHIAGLPVAVNINCHVARHITEVL